MAIDPELVDKDIAIATRSGDTALATVPDWLEGAPDEDQVEAGRPRMPRLAIAQGMSPAMQRQKPEYIKGLELGDLFNTLTKEKYGPGPLEFSVVRRLPARWIEFDEERKVVDPNVLPDDRRTEWRVVDGQRLPPIATQFIDFIVVLLNNMEPIAISCARTNMRAANDLLGLIQIRRPKMIGGKMMRLPEFAMKFTVNSAQAAGPNNSTYGIFVFGQAGDLVNEPEKARMVRAYREQFATETIDIDRSTGDESGEAPTDTSFDVDEMERGRATGPDM